MDFEDDENEIFFGPVTDYEKRKATKLRRRTVVYTPNFRTKLQRTPSKGSGSRISSDDSQSDEKEDVTGSEENPVDVTCDSVFDDDTTAQNNKPNSNHTVSSSLFYSTSEYPVEDSFQNQTCSDTVYHQALSVSEILTPNVEVKDVISGRLLLTSSENEATPTNKIVEFGKESEDCDSSVVKRGKSELHVLKSLKKTHDSTSDSPAKLHLAASKIQGWFRMSKQKRVYNKAFDNMSSLKNKSNKFLEELRMEQRSRGNTPANSPIPSKVVKKSPDDEDNERLPSSRDGPIHGKPTTLSFEESSSSDETSSQEDQTKIDGHLHVDNKLGQSISGVLHGTASRIQTIQAGQCTPTRAASANLNPTEFGTPPQHPNRGMNHNRCNSPLVFSSPKVYPVTVQAQGSRNPMCSVATYSPRPTPSHQSVTTSSMFLSPLMAHKSSPIAVPKAFRPLNDATPGSPSTVMTPGSTFNPVGSSFSPLVKTNTGDNIGQDPSLPTGSTFKPLSLSSDQGHQSPFQQIAATTNEASNKENVLDSPNVTSRRSRKRNAPKSTPTPDTVQVMRPLPIKAPGTGAFHSTSNYLSSPANNISRCVVSMEQQHNAAVTPRQMLVHQEQVSTMSPQQVQMSHLSLLQQKQEELARIRAQKQMIQQKIKEDNAKVMCHVQYIM